MPHVLRPRGPAILRVWTGLRTSLRTLAALDQLLTLVSRKLMRGPGSNAYPA